MKSPIASTPLAIWLDPERALSPEHSQALQVSGWAVMPVTTLDQLLAQAPDAALVVLHLTQDVSRLKAVQQLLQDAGLATPVVCRVERQELDLAVQAAQAGALTVLAAQDLRPASWQRLQSLLQAAATAPSQPPVRNVVFVDPASQHLLALAQKVAQADVTALLVGPTGSGKEVLARVLHEASKRAHAPFVALNCAAMPENLIEDMLFGHEKGAFTGAHRDQKGLFEQAQGGTLFLDEIGEMPMHLQSKLLRVLQERQLTRLGGQQLIQLNVRIVAATNKDLKKAILDREFREDLYYRIATFRMRLLPLAERPGDIVPLALQCLVQHDKKPWQLHPQAQNLLLQYPWPGNVRELENVMRRAMVLCPGHQVTPAHLMFDDWLTACSPAAVATVVAVPPFAPLAALPSTEPLASMDADTQPCALPAFAVPACAVPTLGAAPHHNAAVVHHAAALHEAFSNTNATATAQPNDGSTLAWPNPQPQQDAAAPTDLHSAARMNEHQVIMATLANTPSKSEAAKRLGISPRTLRYKMAQLREHGLALAGAF